MTRRGRGLAAGDVDATAAGGSAAASAVTTADSTRFFFLTKVVRGFGLPLSESEAAVVVPLDDAAFDADVDGDNEVAA